MLKVTRKQRLQPHLTTRAKKWLKTAKIRKPIEVLSNTVALVESSQLNECMLREFSELPLQAETEKEEEKRQKKLTSKSKKDKKKEKTGKKHLVPNLRKHKNKKNKEDKKPLLFVDSESSLSDEPGGEDPVISEHDSDGEGGEGMGESTDGALGKRGGKGEAKQLRQVAMKKTPYAAVTGGSGGREGGVVDERRRRRIEQRKLRRRKKKVLLM